MVSYEAFDQNVKINGQVVHAVVEEAMGRFSDAYRERALTALREEGIDDPASGDWYPQQAWLDAFEAIAEDLQPHVLDRLGQQIPHVATWPNNFDTVPESIHSIHEAYRRNHKGGDIGDYQFEQIDDQTGEIACHNPYPCPFDRGLIRGVAQQSAPVDAFVFIEETGTACRREGADTCQYTLHW